MVDDDNDHGNDDGAWVYYKITYEPSDQVSKKTYELGANAIKSDFPL